MNRSRITGDLVSQNNIFVDIANDRVGIGSTIPGEKLSLPDSAKIALGNSADLSIYHDGSHSRISEVGTGKLILETNGAEIQLNKGTTENMIKCFTDGAVELYHNGTKKFETTSTGCKLTDSNTNAALQFTTSTGNNGYVFADNADTIGFRDANPHWLVKCIKDGAVELYYDNVKKFETTAYGIDVTGTTDTDGLVVSGVTTSIGALTSTGNLTITNTYPSVFLVDSDNDDDFSIQNQNGVFAVRDETNSTNRFTIASNGRATLANDAGVSGNLDVGNGIDVTGNITGTGNLTLTSTDAGSSAAPEIDLFRNSASPADADYLGQIKFQGESDTGVQRNYAKITGKILDASNGTEDGIIEFAHIKAGSQVITGRWRSDSLQLLNGTALTVAGSTTVTGNIIPNSDSATDIGTNSVRFANIYADTLYGDGSNLTGVTSVGGDTGVDFNDNVKIRLGTGNDIEFYHNGSHNFIDITNGQLRIRHGTDNAIKTIADGSVTLYYDGGQRILTTTGGIEIIGETVASSHIKLADNARLKLGTGEDFEMWHNGGTGNTNIKQQTGDVYFYTGSDLNMLMRDGTSVDLYYANSKRFETTSAGATVTGDLSISSTTPILNLIETDASSDYRLLTAGNEFVIQNDASGSFATKFKVTTSGAAVTGELDVSGTIDMNTDTGRLKLGAGDDLSLWHDGSNSYIANTGGQLRIWAKTDGYAITCTADGSVDLYYNNARKFRTVSDGCEITSAEAGDACLALIADEGDDNADYFRLKTANSGGFYLQNYAAGSWETNIKAVGNGAVELYYDNTKRFETTSNGATVTGRILVSGHNNIGLIHQDNVKAVFGTSNDLQIYHSGSHSYIEDSSGTGNLAILTNSLHINNSANTEAIARFNENGAVELYYDNEKRFETLVGGAKFSECNYIDLLAKEGQEAAIYVFADQGDDNADKWRIRANTSGNYYLENKSSGSWETNYKATGEGAVDLYYDNSVKFSTTSTGVSVTGNVITSGNFDSNIDGGRVSVGDSADLYMTHTNNGLIDCNTGNLDIVTQNTLSLKNADSENAVVCNKHGSVDLYCDNGLKFQTRTDGVKLYQGHFYADDSSQIRLGSGQDLKLYHDGTDSHVNNYTGTFYIQAANNLILQNTSGEKYIRALENASVELYYNGNKKFETTSLGVDVNGTLVTGHGDALIVDQSNNLKFCVGEYTSASTSTGTVSMDARTYDTNKARLHKWTSPNAGGGSYGNYSEAWYDGGTYRHIYSMVSGFGFEHHVIPYGNNTYDLGTSSWRWRNIYTMDLQLSNKGSKNDVDGTWGDFTIQEGEDDLFLINRRNGKKYKFNLTEVS